jgi:hypothetical protein
MTLKTLPAVLALGLGLAVLAPGAAEASHRHSRSCGHHDYGYRSHHDGYRSYGYRGSSYRYAPRYGSRGYYRPYYRTTRYYYAPPPYYYYPRRYYRPGLSIHLGFGW